MRQVTDAYVNVTSSRQVFNTVSNASTEWTQNNRKVQDFVKSAAITSVSIRWIYSLSLTKSTHVLKSLLATEQGSAKLNVHRKKRANITDNPKPADL